MQWLYSIIFHYKEFDTILSLRYHQKLTRIEVIEGMLIGNKKRNCELLERGYMNIFQLKGKETCWMRLLVLCVERTPVEHSWINLPFCITVFPICSIVCCYSSEWTQAMGQEGELLYCKEGNTSAVASLLTLLWCNSCFSHGRFAWLHSCKIPSGEQHDFLGDSVSLSSVLPMEHFQPTLGQPEWLFSFPCCGSLWLPWHCSRASTSS